MKAIATNSTQTTFKAEGCFDLPVYVRELKMEGGETVKGHTSYWLPNKEELERLINGGVIALTVIGGQPPVIVETVEVNWPEGKDPRADKTIRQVK